MYLQSITFNLCSQRWKHDWHARDNLKFIVYYFVAPSQVYTVLRQIIISGWLLSTDQNIQTSPIAIRPHGFDPRIKINTLLKYHAKFHVRFRLSESDIRCNGPQVDSTLDLWLFSHILAMKGLKGTRPELSLVTSYAHCSQFRTLTDECVTPHTPSLSTTHPHFPKISRHTYTYIFSVVSMCWAPAVLSSPL